MSEKMLVDFVIIMYFQSFLCNGNVIENSRTTWGAPDNFNIKSVNDIKEDLRRNNDDYKLLKSDKLFSNTAEVKVNTVKNPNRRAYEIIRDGKVFNESIISTKQKRFSKVTPASNIDQRIQATEYVAEDKMEKRIKFMEKHKDLMNSFLRSKKIESQTKPAVMEQDDDAEGDNAAASADTEEIFNRAQNEDQDIVAPGQTPSPYELDMAPAIGGRVHSLRMSNRLCFRNVQIPEGPKYNSKGEVYLKAHNASGHDYANTKAPRIVLPRCCNCCKKSVLGCE